MPDHTYRDGEPCEHPGCLNHVTHPCEGCGRIAGKTEPRATVSSIREGYPGIGVDIKDRGGDWYGGQ